MAGLAALGNPGPFKARKKDPERLLGDFKLYVKAITNLLILTDNGAANNAKKKATMQGVGGIDMVWLFDHIGKVIATDTFAQACNKIEAALTGQTNQASMRHKLFTKFPQGDKSFATWWAEVKGQADKCDFANYNSDKACRDAIIYQTSSKRLRKKVLAEDLNLEQTIKMGMADKQSDMNAGEMTREKERDSSRIRRLEEEIARLQLKPKKNSKAGEKSKCKTCPRGDQHEGRACSGQKAEECFACGKAGHFRGAPICSGKKKGKVRHVEEDEEEDMI